MKYSLEKRDDKWWIVGGEIDMGPYDTKVSADDDRKGLQRTERYGDEPGFACIEKESTLAD
jgi:hypothetical protein